MTTPRIEINVAKIVHNAKKLKELYGSKGIGVTAVTKVVRGDPAIVEALIKSGLDTIADSRIENIQRMHDAGIQARFVLLRTPLLSQVESVVRYADISLNSELSVIKALSKATVKQDTTHRIILMVEMGDLREGIMPLDLEDVVRDVLELDRIELSGIGTNLACLEGVRPDEKKMRRLSSHARVLEEKFGLTFEFVSGGNSANYLWFMSTKDVGKINNLRIGESIFLGCETVYRKPIPGLYTEAFTLVAEVIESKIKPSVPYGAIGQDAFDNIPVFRDHGLIRRALLGVGLQDVMVSRLSPILDVDIIGATSDHIVLDAKEIDLKVGDEVEFNLGYGALLSAMTSPYVIKKYVNDL